MGWIIRWWRLRQFMARVIDRLPKVHPLTGAPLRWKVILGRPGARYDPETGARLGGMLRVLNVQSTIAGGLWSQPFYIYDWTGRERRRRFGHAPFKNSVGKIVATLTQLRKEWF